MNLETTVALIKQRVDNIKKDMEKFVTIDRFNPIEKIVWTITMLLVTSVVTAGLALLFRKP